VIRYWRALFAIAKKGDSRTFQRAGRGLTSIDARVDHVITDKKLLFDLKVVRSHVGVGSGV